MLKPPLRRRRFVITEQNMREIDNGKRKFGEGVREEAIEM